MATIFDHILNSGKNHRVSMEKEKEDGIITIPRITPVYARTPIFFGSYVSYIGKNSYVLINQICNSGSVKKNQDIASILFLEPEIDDGFGEKKFISVFEYNLSFKEDGFFYFNKNFVQFENTKFDAEDVGVLKKRYQTLTDYTIWHTPIGIFSDSSLIDIKQYAGISLKNFNLKNKEEAMYRYVTDALDDTYYQFKEVRKIEHCLLKRDENIKDYIYDNDMFRNLLQNYNELKVFFN